MSGQGNEGDARWVAAGEASEEAGRVFSEFRRVTGGAAWDRVVSLESRGGMSAGGLSGTAHAVRDVATGRSALRYCLGPVQGGEGFDGTVSWEQEPGGEVTVEDTEEARAAARSGAWLVALGYWRRMDAATVDRAGTWNEAGQEYRVVEVTPAGGCPLALWFNADSLLLVRIVKKYLPGVTITTRLEDYRQIDGVCVPFHVIVDGTDPAGRTDPRDRVEFHWQSVATNVSTGGGVLEMPAMTATAGIRDGSGTTCVPFELINNHIYAQAAIDGQAVRVLVDTGGGNVLTPAAARQLGLAGVGRFAARGAGDDITDVAYAPAREVRLGEAVLAKPMFYIMDMGAMWPAVEGMEAAGLVGFEMFRRYRVTIDYAARTLTLTEPARFTPPTGAHVIGFETGTGGRIPIIQGTLDGLPVRLRVDTGSRVSLSLHGPFVRQHDLATRYGAAPETVIGWGSGGAALGRPARLGTLVLGDLAIHDICGDLYMGDKSVFADPALAGNLGGGVLRRFTVSFDYDARCMYLVPNADFARPDDFDRGGMFLLLEGDALKVAAVMPDGAASKAGLAVGDRILRIGGEPTTNRSLCDWRARLRELPAGLRLLVSVEGSGGRREVELVLADAIPPHASGRQAAGCGTRGNDQDTPARGGRSEG